MGKKKVGIFFFISLWLFGSQNWCRAESDLAPVTRQGHKWRIGYYEGGAYQNYPVNLRTIVAGLVELGWMKPVKLPETDDKNQSGPLWQFLAKNVRSNYIEFVADGYWSAQWDSEKRAHLKEKIIQQLNQKHDIDLMIAMGTWAGQDLANDRHHTPTIAVSVSDPVRSGISVSVDDSGLDHVHAKCDPTRYIRQIRLFHRLVQFKKLGVVYENSVAGRTYAALEDIRQVAAERGFSVVTCEAPFSEVDLRVSTNEIIKCHERLVQNVDAVFVTVHRGLDQKRMAEVVAPFLVHHIPTWSQRGPEEVKMGILFSISRGGFKAVGRFHAKVMASIFNGEKPRNIEQIFEDPKLIAINTKVAQMIGFHVPDSVMRVADIIYGEIEW